MVMPIQPGKMGAPPAPGGADEPAPRAAGRPRRVLVVEDNADVSELIQMQLQMWATACQDDEVRALARRRLRKLWELVGRLSGADEARISEFMARGMLVNVFAAMDIPRVQGLLVGPE